MLFNEVPFLDRFAAAADAGFRGVEFLFPYEFSPEAIAQQLEKHGLENVLFNLPPGDFAAGERGLACVPGRESEFRANVERALVYTEHLGTKRLHVVAGIQPAGSSRDDCNATLIANLKFASAQVASHGITLLLEAINNRDIPGFFINLQAEAYEICAAVAEPNVKMQMDCYHMQMMEGDIAGKLRKYAARCGHIQIAGCPGRHEPDTGEIRYEYLFQLLDEIGYDGWIGCEYRPAGRTLDGLEWLRRMGV